MKNINITYIIVAFILGLSIIGYAYINQSSRRAEIIAERLHEDALRREKQGELTRCQNKATRVYQETWKKSCLEKYGTDDCSLPLNIAKSYEDILKDSMDRCISLYK